jgi:hypothetical protein
VIMVIFGSELSVSRVSMGSIHFLFSGTEAAIAAVSKLESGEETNLPMYYYLGFLFLLLHQLTVCTYMPVYQFFVFVCWACFLVAAVYWEGLRSRYSAVRDGVNKFTQGGYEYVKKSGNDAATKAYGTAKATVDKAYETAAGGTTSGETKESEAATSGAGKISQPSGVFESTKQKLGEQYEAAKEAANEQIKVASKLAGDVGQHVKHMAGAGHEEL